MKTAAPAIRRRRAARSATRACSSSRACTDSTSIDPASAAALASETSRAGRTGVYDIVVTNRAGARVALVRGRSARLGDRTVLPVTAAEGTR